MIEQENEVKIKPSGTLKVVPGAKKPNRKRKLYPLLKKLSAVVPAAAIIIIAAFVVYNGTKTVTLEDAAIPEANIGAEIAGYFPARETAACGWWALADYVEDPDDFVPEGLNYKNYGLKLYSCYMEFFEDGTAYIKFPGAEAAARTWGPGGDITIHEIKTIDNIDYMFIESGAHDLIEGDVIPGYYALKRGRARPVFVGDDVCGKDLRNYDLSGMGISIYSIIFDEKTRFPVSRTKRPANESGDAEPAYQPEHILEYGKNPGLGIRALHSRGITGEGVTIAIIDEPLSFDHPEYSGKIVGYRDFGSGAETSAQGPAIAGLLAGENIGTAPGVKIYYAAVPGWKSFDAEYYAAALDWIIEVNETLPAGEKIRAVCITPNPEDPRPWINVYKYLDSFRRASEAGILVLDCTSEHGVVAGACKTGIDDPEDVALCMPVKAYRIFIAPNHYEEAGGDIYNDDEEARADMIRAPVNYRTTARSDSEGDYYQYDGAGALSFALPYITGVLAMGWQLRPELTADEMVKILFGTAHSDDKGNKYIHPAAFIDYIKNN